MDGSGAAAFLDGLRPAQTPKFAGTLGGRLAAGRARARSWSCAVSAAQFDDDLNTDLLKAATTLDAFASWPLVAAASAGRARPRISPTR